MLEVIHLHMCPNMVNCRFLGWDATPGEAKRVILVLFPLVAFRGQAAYLSYNIHKKAVKTIILSYRVCLYVDVYAHS